MVNTRGSGDTIVVIFHDILVVHDSLGGGVAMPIQRLRISSGLHWVCTVIRSPSVGGGLETELYFEVEGRPFSLAFDTVPERSFLLHLYALQSIAIYEVSFEERGWVESGRYRVALDEDHDGLGGEALTCDLVRWAPENLA